MLDGEVMYHVNILNGISAFGRNDFSGSHLDSKPLAILMELEVIRAVARNEPFTESYY